MTTRHARRFASSLITLCVVTALTACGGGGGGHTNDEESTTPTSPAATASPLAAGQSYIGTLSFGDTIRVDLDAPATGQLTLTFADSQFGLAGSLSGSYTQSPSANGTGYVVPALTAGSGAPAGLATRAAQIGLTLFVSIDSSHHGVMSGSLANVPNLRANDGSVLSGQIEASNNGVSTVAALAGTYSFVKLSGDYASNGVAQGDQDAESGQIKIDADGSARFCAGQAYSDTCTNYDQQTGTSSATTGTITVEANQTTYPGAFDVSANGLMLGRLFVSTNNGQTSMFLDQAGTNSDGTFRTGAWAFAGTQTLVDGSADGIWSCSEPAAADDSDTLTGGTQVTLDRFAGPQITQLNSDGTTNTAVTAVPLFYNETFEPKASQSVLTLTSAPVGGLIAGEWTGTYQSHAVTGALVFLPMGLNQMSYLDEVNGNGFFVLGSCVRSFQGSSSV